MSHREEYEAKRIDDIIVDGRWTYLHETDSLSIRGRDLTRRERWWTAWLLLRGGHLELSAWFGIVDCDTLMLDDMRLEVRR